MTRKKRVRVSIACAALLAFVMLVGCRRGDDGPQAYESQTEAYSRPLTLRLSAADAQFSDTLNEVAIRTLTRAVESLDAGRRESDIARLNRIGNSSRIQISRDTYRLLELARHYSVLTGGNYDCTVAPVAYLWGFEGATVPTNMPSDDQRQTAMLGIGSHNISLFDNGSATLTHEQTRVSLDPLMDAYCADMSIVELREKSIANGYLSIGNSARALGSKDGQSWYMLLPDPFGDGTEFGRVHLAAGRAISVVRPRDKTVVIGGKTLCSIINPKTGLPAEGIAMAAVSGNIATKCSVVAHALVVVGVEGAPDILKNFPGCEALIIPDRKPVELWMTPGFVKQAELPAVLRDNIRKIDVPVKDGAAGAATDAPPVSTPPAEK